MAISYISKKNTILSTSGLLYTHVIDLLAKWNGSPASSNLALLRNGMVKWVLDLPCVAAGLQLVPHGDGEPRGK